VAAEDGAGLVGAVVGLDEDDGAALLDLAGVVVGLVVGHLQGDEGAEEAAAGGAEGGATNDAGQQAAAEDGAEAERKGGVKSWTSPRPPRWRSGKR
jgi:hypothetical protein